jgi:selenocysteine lyase/cysteine desulfurase
MSETRSAESANGRSIAEAFPLDPSVIHLNHAAVGPWPWSTVATVQRFAAENGRQGSLHYPDWLAVEHRLRERLAALLGGAPTEGIALVKNTSEGLSLVAHGLPWEPGENVVYPAEDFPSNRIVWESLAAYGVEPRAVPLAGCAEPEAELEAAMDSHTRLLAVSAVHYATGLRLDLPRLGLACRRRGVRYCIDGIQQLGALDFRQSDIGADFIAADGHKWMCAPEGIGLFYCNPDRLGELNLHQHGWRMVAEPDAFEQHHWEPATTARRFEPGSPNLLGIHALDSSLEVLLSHGLDRVEADLHERVDYLEAGLQAIPTMECLSDRRPGRRSGILTFRSRAVELDTLAERLQNIGVFFARRGGGIRFSPHFYTPYERLDTALDGLRRAVR